MILRGDMGIRTASAKLASLTALVLVTSACGDGGLFDPRGFPGGSGGDAGTGGATGTGGVTGTGGSAGTGGFIGTGGGAGSAGTGGSSGALCDAGPLAAPIPDCAPTPLPTTGDPAQDCVDRINQLRWECQCLPPLERWTAGEGCADQHSEYDSTRSPHAGFRDNICSPGGWAQNECPGWNSEQHIITGCLQAMWDEGPGEPYSEHGHYINMTNPSYSTVACGFYETPGGAVWSVQNFQ